MEMNDKRFTPDHITELSKCEIFVFGSNLEGQHAGGAARFILGLAADIKILKGKKLLDYIKKYDKKHIQKLG